MEESLEGVTGLLAIPDDCPPSSAVLVLAGSSGRVEEGRVRILAEHGAAAASFRWFGGPGQSPGICEIPLETFIPVLDRLAAISPRLAVIGLSKGAEAALLLAARDPRITAVAAFAPSHVVWANVGAGSDGQDRPQRSSWTADGQPLPFVPYAAGWAPVSVDGRIAFRSWYQQSLRGHADRIPAATIPVERIGGEVLLVAGGDDQLWPSVDLAEQIRARRAAHQLPTTVISLPAAGHRTLLPGESAPVGGRTDIDHGGSPEADAELGALVWPALGELLGLDR
ncbi:MAG TPA: acyl-CoA thioester hydrolase/BAAT C-terminal domain-containing protein [Pseudonocardiaceae bacterium]|jgi:hypothetical protein|nr:acyl-CoA thioester hydrolase/BAAT C-terminal domain-containing protein [Pseudonocardiaceae bacterium]